MSIDGEPQSNEGEVSTELDEDGFRRLKRLIHRFVEAPAERIAYCPAFLVINSPATLAALVDRLQQDISNPDQLVVLDAEQIPRGHPQNLMFALVRYFPAGRVFIQQELEKLTDSFRRQSGIQQLADEVASDIPAPAVLIVANTDALLLQPDGTTADRSSLVFVEVLNYVRDNLADELLPALVLFQVSPSGEHVFREHARDTAEWMDSLAV